MTVYERIMNGISGLNFPDLNCLMQTGSDGRSRFAIEYRLLDIKIAEMNGLPIFDLCFMRNNRRLCNLFLHNLHRVYTEKQKQNDFADYVDKTGPLCYIMGTTYCCGADRPGAAFPDLNRSRIGDTGRSTGSGKLKTA